MTDKNIGASLPESDRLASTPAASREPSDAHGGGVDLTVQLQLSPKSERDLIAQLGSRFDEFLKGLNGRLQTFPLVLTKQEVANRLQVSVRTVETLIAEGEIVQTKVRGQVRISSDALEAYLRRASRRGGVR